MTSADFALLAAGIFFLTGLLTGVWKYVAIMRSDNARAPYYVDIAHRSSLMYSFAAILVREFIPYSPFSERITFIIVAAQLLFFGSAIITYLVHGMLKDTNNQLKRPHQLGKYYLPSLLVRGYMWALIVAELGGFALLLAGAGYTIFGCNPATRLSSWIVQGLSA